MQYEPQAQVTFLTVEGSHDVLLPNLDFKIDLSENLVGRVSVGQTIARAPLGDLAGGRSLSGSPRPGSRSGGQGNTNLLPYKSTNFDLALEYYYGEGSYAAIGYFRKDVDNFIQRTISEVTVDGLRDIFEGPRYQQAVASLEGRGEQATSTAIFQEMIDLGFANADGVIEPNADDPLIVWQVTQPNNTESKRVHGLEMAVQHVFGESGFGLGVNGTLVSGDVKFDNESLTQQSPLNGISNSANLQGFYEKHGWSIKATYAWRDSYLIGTGQAQGSAEGPPQYARPYQQWDLNVQYSFTDNLTVSFEGINLTNETEQGYGRYKEQFLFARQYGPRYAMSVRFSY